MSGTYITGLIKTVTEEQLPSGSVLITTRRYDPDSSPPQLLSEDCTIRLPHEI